MPKYCTIIIQQLSLIGSKNPTRNVIQKPVNTTQQVVTSNSTGAK